MTRRRDDAAWRPRKRAIAERARERGGRAGRRTGGGWSTSAKRLARGPTRGPILRETAGYMYSFGLAKDVPDWPSTILYLLYTTMNESNLQTRTSKQFDPPYADKGKLGEYSNRKSLRQ